MSNAITICFNYYYSLHFLCLHNNNSSIDLYNRDLQTTIILFTCNVSLHNTDWILSESPLLALSYLLYRMLSSLVNTLDGECLALREISINVNNLLAVLLLPVNLFICFFTPMLLLYFCQVVDHVNKLIIIVLGAFVYNFNNTISVFEVAVV